MVVQNNFSPNLLPLWPFSALYVQAVPLTSFRQAHFRSPRPVIWTLTCALERERLMLASLADGETQHWHPLIQFLCYAFFHNLFLSTDPLKHLTTKPFIISLDFFVFQILRCAFTRGSFSSVYFNPIFSRRKYYLQYTKSLNASILFENGRQGIR